MVWTGSKAYFISQGRDFACIARQNMASSINDHKIDSCDTDIVIDMHFIIYYISTLLLV